MGIHSVQVRHQVARVGGQPDVDRVDMADGQTVRSRTVRRRGQEHGYNQVYGIDQEHRETGYVGVYGCVLSWAGLQMGGVNRNRAAYFHLANFDYYLYIVYTLYIVQCIMYSVQCKVYNVHCTCIILNHS